MTKRLGIVGATGMVGGYALRYALDDSDGGAVMAIVRRKLGSSHPKLNEVLHPDFNQGIRAGDLARVMVDAAVQGTPEHTGPVFENRDIRAMVVSLE